MERSYLFALRRNPRAHGGHARTRGRVRVRRPDHRLPRLYLCVYPAPAHGSLRCGRQNACRRRSAGSPDADAVRRPPARSGLRLVRRFGSGSFLLRHDARRNGSFPEIGAEARGPRSARRALPRPFATLAAPRNLSDLACNLAGHRFPRERAVLPVDRVFRGVADDRSRPRHAAGLPAHRFGPRGPGATVPAAPAWRTRRTMRISRQAWGNAPWIRVRSRRSRRLPPRHGRLRLDFRPGKASRPRPVGLSRLPPGILRPALGHPHSGSALAAV